MIKMETQADSPDMHRPRKWHDGKKRRDGREERRRERRGEKEQIAEVKRGKRKKEKGKRDKAEERSHTSICNHIKEDKDIPPIGNAHACPT